MTASDDLLELLGSAYDALASGDTSPLLRLVATDAQCVVTDEVELRQERLPLVAALARLADLSATGHRVVAGATPRVSVSGARVWATDDTTVVLPDGALRPLQVTVLATTTSDGGVLVDQVNLAVPAQDRATAPLDLVG